MEKLGRYGGTNGGTFSLPGGWDPVGDVVLSTASEQAIAALTGGEHLRRVARYYDRETSYAGTLFLDAEPNQSFEITPSDLYAVTSLSMKLDARHGRLLIDSGDVRDSVRQQLRGLLPTLPITALEHGQGGSAETLDRMYGLHSRLRSLLGDRSNRWVFAAKLCARKRPRLFPVRDNLVCKYLAGGRTLKQGDGWPGDFPIDIQVYAYLMTLPVVQAALSWLRDSLTEERGIRIDEEDLRLLDAALWMAANQSR